MNSRREFLTSSLRASLAFSAANAFPRVLSAQDPAPEPKPRPEVVRGTLAQRFPDLRRHFVFEYYPWYGGPPDYFHWTQWDRVPPWDLASNYVPKLGAYDSRSRAVIEQHARWIADAGAGAISLSWWGRDSFEDRAVHGVMDVMRDHGIKVSFHLEPYAADRGRRYASDVLYLLREYGERRRWDALLFLRDANGRESPVFKGSAMIVPERIRDCHGVERRVDIYTPDTLWRQQLDTVRDTLRQDFSALKLLTDSFDFGRVQSSGFDGFAIYDHFVAPDRYARLARQATQAGLLFSFNCNPGFDTIEPRRLAPDECHTPRSFEPPTPGLDWTRAEHRELAAQRSLQRIEESLTATLAVQTDTGLQNYRRGFFLVYLNSFNEWHEGHSFEPMKDAAVLTEVEAAFGYHNPERGDYRLDALRRLLRPVLQPASPAPALTRSAA